MGGLALGGRRPLRYRVQITKRILQRGGGEAAIVFFSMATSTGADMVRSADFLFSRNRLNVAISRARCLAYLVCTDELLNATVKEYFGPETAAKKAWRQQVLGDWEL